MLGFLLSTTIATASPPILSCEDFHWLTHDLTELGIPTSTRIDIWLKISKGTDPSCFEIKQDE